MTNEQWKQVEIKLNGILTGVKLRVDGYDISLLTVSTGNLKFEIAVYVNGKIKGEWIVKDCEIRRRFYHHGRKSLVSKRQYMEQFAKTKSKKERAEREKYFEEHCMYDYYEPYFGSVRTLKAHFIANNESIELVE